MTDFQKAEFLKYGCLSKAIIKACDSQISVGDFCAKYGEWFRPEFYGMPIADKIPLIIQDFGFRISADEWDFYSVRASLFDGKPVITFSHVMLKDGDGAEFNHATVLHSIADDSFQVWSYFQSGNEGLMSAFPISWWVEKKFHGLILTPKDSQQNTSLH